MRRFQLSGGTLVFLGAVLWSLNSPLVKYLTLDPMLICGLRSLIACVTLAPAIRPRRLRWNRWMLLYIGSYAGLCINIILALSMTAAPVAIGMQYTAAVWLFLAQWLKTRRFNRRAFAPVCVILVGVVCFMCSAQSGSGQTGNLIALSEGIFFAVMTVSSPRAAGDNPVGLTALANLFTGAVVWLISSGSFAEIRTISSLDWILMVILGTVQVGAGYAFYNLGVQRVSPQRAAIIALWEMILGPVWVALFLKEYPSPMVLAGFSIILAGMLLDTKMNAKKSS